MEDQIPVVSSDNSSDKHIKTRLAIIIGVFILLIFVIIGLVLWQKTQSVTTDVPSSAPSLPPSLPPLGTIIENDPKTREVTVAGFVFKKQSDGLLLSTNNENEWIKIFLEPGQEINLISGGEKKVVAWEQVDRTQLVEITTQRVVNNQLRVTTIRLKSPSPSASPGAAKYVD